MMFGFRVYHFFPLRVAQKMAMKGIENTTPLRSSMLTQKKCSEAMKFFY